MSGFNIQEELKQLPDRPGVYIMKDELGQIIYVGKAVVLKNRVRQYFQSSRNQSVKTQALVQKIKSFEYIVTDTEVEALILECNLIKKHRPRYNILLKDDKNYPYIKVTMNEEYPRILMSRRFDKDGAKYFGPYTSAGAVRETIDVIKRFFPVKTCNKVFPRDLGKVRPCLNYHIYQCLGPCQGDVNKDAYRAMMKDVCTFLSGGLEEIIKKLEDKMKEAAISMEFEKAAGYRDKISSLKLIAEKQKIISTGTDDQDIIGVATSGNDSCVQVFFIRSGKLVGREHFILNETTGVDEAELISSFVKQFYLSASFVPKEVVLQHEVDELEIIQSWLSEKKGAAVYIKVPKRGDKSKLLEMVHQNAVIALKHYQERITRDGLISGGGLTALTEEINLAEPPYRIEAFDISNTGESEIVASMVVFEQGKSNNKEYRRFKIKSTGTQNDYLSMQEVIYRRFTHAQRESAEQGKSRNAVAEQSTEYQAVAQSIIEQDTASGKFTKLPDLILVDGGLGHVNAVQNILDELSVDIPVWGMVKDDRHRTRGLISVDGEINLSANLTLLRFITAIQDEAHRFALKYNKSLRQKRHSVSALDEIAGIGPKRKKALMKAFGSVNRIKQASYEQLTAVEGVSESLAQQVYDYFH